MPETTLPIQEEGSMTITSECLIPFVQLIENMYLFSTKCLVTCSVDRKYAFVFYKMSCYYIYVNCISVNLINKTETNKTYLIKTIIIDTN